MTRQRGADHRRPQIGPANADIHHIGDGPVPNRVGKIRKPRIFRALAAIRGALRHMDNGAILGFVDRLTGKQGIDTGFETGFRRQIKKRQKGPRRDLVARQINPQIIHLIDKAAGPPGIGKQIAKMHLVKRDSLGAERGGSVCRQHIP
jgi:hypothetical protein